MVFSLVNNDIYFIDCQVQFNFAEYGGGVVFAEASNVHFSSSNVQNNGAARGAVAYLEIATATITNSTFIKNGGRACVMGGVIYGITSSKWLSDASTYRSNQVSIVDFAKRNHFLPN